MRCPRCATFIDDESWVCSHCGSPVRPRHHVVRLEFRGNPIQVLGWMLLACLVGIRIGLPQLVHLHLVRIDVSSGNLALWIAAILLALPGPWVLEGACRWFCRNLRFSNDATADFSGKGAQIFGWYVLLILNRDDWKLSEPWQGYLLEGALFFLGIWATLQILRWFVEHVDLSSGWRFSFTGGYRDLLFWEVLLALSCITIVGWAWVLAAMYRWLGENTRAKGQALRFHGRGHQILWRTLAAALFSIPIVTIPWAWLWYAQWLVRNVTIDGQLAEAAA